MYGYISKVNTAIRCSGNPIVGDSSNRTALLAGFAAHHSCIDSSTIHVVDCDIWLANSPSDVSRICRAYGDTWRESVPPKTLHRKTGHSRDFGVTMRRQCTKRHTSTRYVRSLISLHCQSVSIQCYQFFLPENAPNTLETRRWRSLHAMYIYKFHVTDNAITGGDEQTMPTVKAHRHQVFHALNTSSIRAAKDGTPDQGLPQTTDFVKVFGRVYSTIGQHLLPLILKRWFFDFCL